ncbi:Alpha/Beta hydrolase protein [Collybia nuda]|uniref:Alpha/Beta hydrolase protein n=1 Tax=Collybia nuda TaxID=64659 RepID=A0A9P5Y9W8_9AGAR|nr:Alpha/Beta hydrolase protein [Collybia nuda]
MDPLIPESFNHRTEKLSTGRTYHFVDQLPEGYDSKRTPTVLCVHGFPDLWYGWRYQIGPWVRKGSRVIAPDMLGYGGTDKPADASEYSTKKLCSDLVALLDLLGIRKVILIGHDWGAFTVGRFSLWYPERLLALVMLSVPYTPPSRVYLPVDEVARLAPNLGYQVFFSNKESTRYIEENLGQFMSLTFRAPESAVDYTSLGSLQKMLQIPRVEQFKGRSVLSDVEFKYYESQLSKGMNGPLNYYRTAKFRHDEEMDASLPSNLPPNLPVLFMWGTCDSTATPFLINKARKFIARLQDVALEGRGHWVLTEAKDDVTEIVVNWLNGLTSQPTRRGKL